MGFKWVGHGMKDIGHESCAMACFTNNEDMGTEKTSLQRRKTKAVEREN